MNHGRPTHSPEQTPPGQERRLGMDQRRGMAGSRRAATSEGGLDLMEREQRDWSQFALLLVDVQQSFWPRGGKPL